MPKEKVSAGGKSRSRLFAPKDKAKMSPEPAIQKKGKSPQISQLNIGQLHACKGEPIPLPQVVNGLFAQDLMGRAQLICDQVYGAVQIIHQNADRPCSEGLEERVQLTLNGLRELNNRLYETIQTIEGQSGLNDPIQPIQPTQSLMS